MACSMPSASRRHRHRRRGTVALSSSAKAQATCRSVRGYTIGGSGDRSVNVCLYTNIVIFVRLRRECRAPTDATIEVRWH